MPKKLQTGKKIIEGLPAIGSNNWDYLILGKAPGDNTLKIYEECGKKYPMYFLDASNVFWLAMKYIFPNDSSIEKIVKIIYSQEKNEIDEKEFKIWLQKHLLFLDEGKIKNIVETINNESNKININNYKELYNLQSSFCNRHHIKIRDRVHSFTGVGSTDKKRKAITRTEIGNEIIRRLKNSQEDCTLNLIFLSDIDPKKENGMYFTDILEEKNKKIGLSQGFINNLIKEGFESQNLIETIKVDELKNNGFRFILKKENKEHNVFIWIGNDSSNSSEYVSKKKIEWIINGKNKGQYWNKFFGTCNIS